MEKVYLRTGLPSDDLTISLTTNSDKINMNIKKTNSTAPRPVSILAYRNDLKSVVGNGLPKVGWFRRHKLFRTWKRVLVEPAPAGVRDSVFFAPDKPITDSRATPTEFVNVNPEGHDNLVHQGDEFEISFVGMSVSPQDCFAFNKNELLLYSLIRDEQEKVDVGFTFERGSPSAVGSPPLLMGMRRKSIRSSYYTGPTGFAPSPTDSPFIHYDPVVDGHDVGNEPDSFVPVPASKALYLQNTSHQMCQGGPENSVSIRFTVLEVDKVSDSQIRAIAGFGDMGQTIGQAGVALPYLELLSGAFQIATLLGKKGLQKYSRPDHVISKDVEFKLAPATHDVRSMSSGEHSEDDPRGSYLRYGYYFFLNKTVDAKLYAQAGSSSQHVPLLLKRENFDPEGAPKNEKPYFPLTGVSYVVVKVTRGVAHKCPVDRENLQKEHRRRLDSMLQVSSMMEMFANFEGNKGQGRLERERKNASQEKRR